MRSQMALAGLCTCAVLLGGCSGSTLMGPAVATYGAANILSPVGYSQSQVDETHYKVSATGSEVTPSVRVEKLAKARAAQIGVDMKLPYFKVAGVEHGVACSKKETSYKGPSTAGSSRPTVVLDVLYSKEQADPTYQPASATFDALSAELASETISPEQQQVASQEIKARCGKS